MAPPWVRERLSAHFLRQVRLQVPLEPSTGSARSVLPAADSTDQGVAEPALESNYSCSGAFND